MHTGEIEIHQHLHQRLSRNLIIQAVLGALGLLWMLLIPSDRGAGPLGFSTQRLALIAGLAFLSMLFAGSAAYLWRRPEQDRGAFAWVERRMQRPSTGAIVQGAAAVWLFLALSISFAYFLYLREWQQAIALRLAPMALAFSGAAIQVLVVAPFRDPKSWRSLTLGLTLALTASSIILQQIMEAGVSRPSRLSLQAWLASWALAFLLSLLLSFQLARGSSQKRLAWILFLAFAWLWLLLERDVAPSHVWPARDYKLIYYSPAILLGGALLIHGLLGFNAWLNGRYAKPLKIALLCALAVGLTLSGILYYSAATKHAREINTTVDQTDQGSYLAIAEQVRQTGFRYPGDFNRTPLYPYLQALFYREGMSGGEFFARGKQVNILVSLGALVVLLLVFSRNFPMLHAALLAMIAAYSLYIFNAGYVEVELLYYLLSFLAFAGMLTMLSQPTLRSGLATGAVTGLAYLSKASMLPGLGIFSVVYGLQVAGKYLRGRKASQTAVADQRRELLRRAGYLMALLAVFVILAYPYARATHQKYGRYLFNINTNIMMWSDSFYEGTMTVLEEGFLDGWPAHLPAEELPGPVNYFRRHTFEQIVLRLRYGISAQAGNLYFTYGYSNYTISYLLILILAALADIKNTFSTIKKHPYPILFTILFIGAYLALFAWYALISAGRRFTFGIYLPLLFSLFRAIQSLARQSSQESPRIDLKLFHDATDLWMALVLFLDIWYVLTRSMMMGRFEL